MGIPTIGQTKELLPLPALASIWKDLRLMGILGLLKRSLEMANDQAEALSSDKEVTDECLDDEQVGESRPNKRIRVIKEEMVKDQK
ncbi:hypothetical protein Tco_1437362 [Tanacetum coccineum]